MEALVRHYEQPLYNAAYRLLGNPDDAADATQTGFLKAFQAIDGFDPKYRFFSWIYRITLNEARDQLRRRRTRGGDAADDSTDRLVDPGAQPEAETSAGETGDVVQAAIGTLGDDLRAVVVMRYWGGASYREISETLGVPEQTVKSRLFTARQRMKGGLLRQGVRAP